MSSKTSFDKHPPVAVVTGAGGGLGRVYARTLLSHGFQVAAFSRQLHDAEETLLDTPEAKSSPSGWKHFALPLQVDLTNPEAIAKGFKQVRETLGSPTLLVNNAAFADAVGPSWEVDPNDWWRCFEINVFAPYLCFRQALGSMRDQGFGRIINLVGDTGQQSQPYMAAYSASKAALARYTLAMAQELKGSGVQVFAFCPGTVPTPSLLRGLTKHAAQGWLAELGNVVASGHTLSLEQSAAALMRIATGELDHASLELLRANELLQSKQSTASGPTADSGQAPQSSTDPTHHELTAPELQRLSAALTMTDLPQATLAAGVFSPSRLSLRVVWPDHQATIYIEPLKPGTRCFRKTQTLALSIQGGAVPAAAEALVQAWCNGPLFATPFEQLAGLLTPMVSGPHPVKPTQTKPTESVSPIGVPNTKDHLKGPEANGHEDAPSYPALRTVEWCATRACNLACRHCIVQGHLPLDNELGTHEALHLLETMASMGLHELHLTGGEFMCRPDWLLLLQQALAAFPSVKLATNGWLGETLLGTLPFLPNPERLYVTISLDGPELIHDARRCKGSFQRALHLLQSLGNRPCCVLTAVGSDNLDSLPELEPTLRPLGAVWSLFPVRVGGRADSLAALSDSLWPWLRSFVETTASRWNAPQRLTVPEWFANPTTTPDTFFGQASAGTHLFIDPQGTVALDQGQLQSAVGNLRSNRLQHLWAKAHRSPEFVDKS